MSPACRASNGAIPPVWWRRHRQASHARVPVQRNSPRLLSVRPRLGAAWRPRRKPPRRQTPTTGCRGQGGLRCGRNGAWPGVSLAHEPLNMRVNPVTRTPTPRDAPGRRCRAYHRTHARIRGPTRISSDPRAKCRTHAHAIGSTCAARSAGSSRSEQFRMQFD